MPDTSLRTLRRGHFRCDDCSWQPQSASGAPRSSRVRLLGPSSLAGDAPGCSSWPAAASRSTCSRCQTPRYGSGAVPVFFTRSPRSDPPGAYDSPASRCQTPRYSRVTTLDLRKRPTPSGAISSRICWLQSRRPRRGRRGPTHRRANPGRARPRCRGTIRQRARRQWRPHPDLRLHQTVERRQDEQRRDPLTDEVRDLQLASHRERGRDHQRAQGQPHQQRRLHPPDLILHHPICFHASLPRSLGLAHQGVHALHPLHLR